MSRFFKLVIGLVVVLAVVAVPTMVMAADDIQVGVAWDKKSGMAETVAKAMDEYLKENAPQIKLEFQKETGVGEPFDTVVNRFEKEKKAMVLLRSDAAKYLVKNSPQIPAFIGACNDPIQLGVCKDYNKPQNDITGVTYALEVETQFKTFVYVVPKMKSVLLLLSKGHAGTPIDQKQTKAVCKKLKIKYNEAICKDKKEVLAAVKKYKDQVSVIIIGSQSLIMDNTAELVAAAPKVPFISYSSKPVMAGALCGFAADDTKLGKFLAESIIEVFVNKVPVAQVPIKVDPKPQLFINAKTAEALELDIPFVILNAAKIVGVDKKEKEDVKKK